MKFKRADAIGAILALWLGAFLWQMNARVWQPNQRRASCQSNLKRVGLGMLQYIRDYDECFPRRENWMRALLPYNKNSSDFLCPSRGSYQSGYAMNVRLDRMSMSRFDYPNDTKDKVMVFDANVPGFNATGTGQLWPRPFRHRDGNNVAFYDGHVALRTKARFDFKIEPLPTPFPTPTPVGKPRAKKPK